MKTDAQFEDFFSRYPAQVQANAHALRGVLADALPEITEQLDLPAKLCGYAYGPSYAASICTLIPSQKGLKLGFFRGVELPDPAGLLAGTGKVSRYVEIRSTEQIHSPEIAALLQAALSACRARMAAKQQPCNPLTDKPIPIIPEARAQTHFATVYLPSQSIALN